MKARMTCSLAAGALLFMVLPVQAGPQAAGVVAGPDRAGSAVLLVHSPKSKPYRRYRQDRELRSYRVYRQPRYYAGYGWAYGYPPPRFGSLDWWIANRWFSRDR